MNRSLFMFLVGVVITFLICQNISLRLENKKMHEIWMGMREYRATHCICRP